MLSAASVLRLMNLILSFVAPVRHRPSGPLYVLTALFSSLLFFWEYCAFIYSSRNGGTDFDHKQFYLVFDHHDSDTAGSQRRWDGREKGFAYVPDRANTV